MLLDLHLSFVSVFRVASFLLFSIFICVLILSFPAGVQFLLLAMLCFCFCFFVSFFSIFDLVLFVYCLPYAVLVLVFNITCVATMTAIL